MSDSSTPVPDSATVLARAERVLVDSGDNEAARLLARLGFALEPEPESWSLSGRTVLAWRGVLLCPADLILGLRADAALRERLRAALAAAFDTRQRTLRELLVLLDDVSMPSTPDDAPAGHPYRDARGHSLPHPAVLLAAARHCLRAWGDTQADAVLGRASIDFEPLPSHARGHSAHRVIVSLPLDDVARVARDRSLHDRLADAVRTVALGAHRTVTEVVVAPDWSLPGVPAAAASSADRAAVTLRDLLEAEGLACGVLMRDAASVRLLATRAGKLAMVEVSDHDAGPAHTSVVHVAIDHRSGHLPDAARAIRKAIDES